MSYADAVAGMTAVFEAMGTIPVVLDYEPSTIQGTPCIYTLLDGAEFERSVDSTANVYRLLHRLLFRWTDAAMCEQELIPFVDAVVEAVDADPHLGGRFPNGEAFIERVEGGWVPVGSIVYRTLDFYSVVMG